MSKQIIRFNKNKDNFYLVKNRHYIKYKTREKEVIQIDNALMDSTKDLYITFSDTNGIKHKNVKVDTNEFYTWFNGEDDFGDWRTFSWDFPTEFGHIYIHALNVACLIGKDIYHVKKIDKVSVQVEIC